MSIFRNPILLIPLLAAMSACPGPTDGGDGGEFTDTDGCDRGACALESEACPASTIVVNGDVTCATCVDDGLDVEVCGEVEEARCVEQENAFGDACQRCTTLGGRILFDDCFADNARFALTCERAALAGSQNGQCVSDDDCPVDHLCQSNGFCVPAGDADCAPDDDECGNERPENLEAPPEYVDETQCEICRDDDGTVVSTRCTPRAETCGEVEVAGRTCQECVDDEGTLVFRRCDPLDIDPRVCVFYGDENGFCIDCFDESDDLLSHECVVGPSSLASCESIVTPEGYGCTRCYDAFGFLVEEQCMDTPPLAERCQELVYSDQTCVGCVGPNNELLSLECWSNECDDEQNCAPPAPCEMVFHSDGTLCRVCLAESNDGFVEETQCFDDGDLDCFEVSSFSDPSSPGDGQTPDDASLIAERCVVCYDGEVEVYRECNGGGEPVPPICETYVDDVTGEMCEVCFEGQTGDYVYSSCPSDAVCFEEFGPDGSVCTTCYDQWSGNILQSSCGPSFCGEENGLAVTNENGEPVTHPSTDAIAGDPLIADCVTCGDEAFGERVDSCHVRTSCDGFGGADPGFVPAPVDDCELVSLSFDILQCERPWGQGTWGIDEIITIIAWGVVDFQVVFHDATIAGGYGTNTCEACSCSSGERLFVSTTVDDAERLMMLNVGFQFE